MFDSTVKSVKRDLYTAQVYGIVSYFAKHLKLLVTYGDIASALGSVPRGGQLAQALAAITEADHNANRPLSTSVVVGKHSGKPGSGFYAQAKQLGYNTGGTDAHHEAFWARQLDRLGVFPATLADKYGHYPTDCDGRSVVAESPQVVATIHPAVSPSVTLGEDGWPAKNQNRQPQHGPNVKKRPLDADDTVEVLKARLRQADKAGWTGNAGVETTADEPVEHSQLPGDR